MCSESPQHRGYSELLLEEIALEGLDGISLGTLWKRLAVNPEWILKPMDNFIEEFVWKHLISLTEVRWYELPQERENPPVFANLDDLLGAIDRSEIDPNKLGSRFYKYHEIRTDQEMGSCAEYKTRTDVTQEVLKNCTLSNARSKWSERLVIVAHQEVRSYVLFSGDLHYELDVIDTTAYCILERIGRARRCGELSTSLNFIRNGANPTSYFWNKLRKKQLISSQNISIKTKCSTLFLLRRFHKDIGKLAANILVTIIENIESSPKKARTLVELKQINPKICKLLRRSTYREYLQVLKVPYSEYYTNSRLKEQKTKNGKERIVTIIKLVEKAGTHKPIPVCDVDDDADDDEDEDEEGFPGIIEETRLANKPLISQCFHIINEAGENGICQVDVARKLGVNKLLARMLLKSLTKFGSIVCSSAEDAKRRSYNYYSKNFSYVKEQKLKQMNDMSTEILNNSDQSMSRVVNDHSDEKDKEENKKKRKRESSNCESEAEDKEKSKTPNTKKVIDNANIIELKNENLYVMRRVNIILEHVYRNQVELKMNLKQIIQREENKQGFFQGDLDRRSLMKVLDILVNCKKIKIITVNVTEPAFNKSREIVFVCMPNVTEEHPIIKASVQQAKDSLSVLYIKNVGAKKKSSSDIRPVFYIGAKNNTKYGHAPKFVRMRLLHELLFYTMFSYQGDENLDTEGYNAFIKSVRDDFEVDEKLPKCYVKEISWKMFIPPLMKYEEYKEGWVAQNDIIERIPLRLLFMLIRLPYEVPNLEEYLSHPIKQHYLVHDLPVEMQKIIRIDKQYQYLLNMTFRFLAMIGLIQFGPKLSYRGNVNLVYVNRKAELLDTRICSPGYSKINLDVNYPVHRYELKSLSDVETYWNDAMRFALGTKLGVHKFMESQAQNSERLPDRLKTTLEPCAVDHAPSRDTGKTPGDGQGALGYDSTLYAHLVRSWFFSRKRSNESETDKTESAVAKRSKLMEQISNRKTVTKMKRFRYMAPKKMKVKKKDGRLAYDKDDEEALQNMKTLRVQWSRVEDDLLVIVYLASLYSAEYHPGYRPVRLIRKLMHESCEKSLDKTALACSRRIYRLMKDKVKEHTVNVHLKELFQDANLKEKIQKLEDEAKKYSKDKNAQNLTSTLDKLTETVFRYLRDTVKAAEISSKAMYKTTLPDDIETFRNLCNYEYPGVTCNEKSLLLRTDSDISVFVIINLIFSTLLSQVDKKKKFNTNFMHHIFRNFDDTRLKSALSYVRGHRLISFNKCNERSRSSYLPIGQGVYHLSMTFHLLLKALYPVEVHSQMYSRYLEMIGHRNCGYVDINSYEAGLSLFLMAYFVLNEVNFDVTVPENVLFFDTKPLPFIDPEEMAKPMFEAKSSFTDQTLSLIREVFFDDKVIKDKASGFSNKHQHSQDSDSDTDVEFEKDADLKNSTNSNIALYLTRRQFRHSEVRFSNAYDHFLINIFPMKYKIDNAGPSHELTSLAAENKNLIKSIEKRMIYHKLKYTVEETSAKIRKYLSTPRERDYATTVLQFVRQCGLCGATNNMLKNKFEDLPLLKKASDTLCKAKLMVRSGSKFTHYIHVEYAVSWLLPCQKNVELFVYEGVKDDEPVVMNRNKMEKMMASKNEGQIWVNIMPWIHVNGTLNREALNSLLIRIVSYITKWPCSSMEQIQNKFSPALQPFHTRELLEILERMKCVKMSVFLVPQEVSLFSSTDFDYTVHDHATGFEDENTIIVEADVNVMYKLSVFLESANYKDLLETKYSTDVSSTVDEPSEVQGNNVSNDGDEEGGF